MTAPETDSVIDAREILRTGRKHPIFWKLYGELEQHAEDCDKCQSFLGKVRQKALGKKVKVPFPCSVGTELNEVLEALWEIANLWRLTKGGDA
jgi:hypothetical protein